MSETNKKVGSNKKIWVAGICLVAIIAIFAIVYSLNKPQTADGSKNIVVEVVNADQESKEYKISTDEEFLRGALEQENLIEGTEGDFGLFVTKVDGVAADEAKQEWWCFTKGSEQVNTSVDETPIADGDHFEITLTVGF